MTINLLIVDDSGAVRHALEELISGERDIKLQASVPDPYAAANEIKKQVPDVIILDVEMPKMDGITFLKKIMSQRPIPTIVCSTLTSSGSPKCLEALRAGAVEVLEKPRVSTKKAFEQSKLDLVDKIRAAACSKVSQKASRHAGLATRTVSTQPKLHPDQLIPRRCFKPGRMESPLIAIGASTGGTVALEEVLKSIPAGTPPIVVVQHMPENFTASFAKRLDSVCAINVKEASNFDRLQPGTCYIAPGNMHMIVKPTYQIELMDGPPITRHKPSVDILFRSVASAAGPYAVAAILTGMGDDGAIGMKELHEEGAYTIAQNEASCVVYGMPKEAVDIGAVRSVQHLSRISEDILAHLPK